MAGTIADQYASLMGSQPAFVYTTQDIAPPMVQQQQQGSPLGVPPPMSIAGQSVPDSTGAGAAWAASVNQRSPQNHPIFWSIALLSIGVIGLAWVAHLEVRRR